MTMNDLDDDYEPEFAVVPEGEQLEVDEVRPERESRMRRAVIGITAGSFSDMVVIPRAEAGPLLRAVHADPLPFGGFIGQYNGENVEVHHLDIITPVCERYWPEINDFLYGPATALEPILRQAGIEPTPLPADFMDPFERGLARYAIYGTSRKTQELEP